MLHKFTTDKLCPKCKKVLERRVLEDIAWYKCNTCEEVFDDDEVDDGSEE